MVLLVRVTFSGPSPRICVGQNRARDQARGASVMKGVKPLEVVGAPSLQSSR